MQLYAMGMLVGKYCGPFYIEQSIAAGKARGQANIAHLFYSHEL